MQLTTNQEKRLISLLGAGGLVMVGEYRGGAHDVFTYQVKDKKTKELQRDAKGEILTDDIERFKFLAEYDVPGSGIPKSVIVEWGAQKKGDKCPSLEAKRGAVVVVWVDGVRTSGKGETIVSASHVELVTDQPVTVKSAEK